MSYNGKFNLANLGALCLKIGSGATPRGGKDTYLKSGRFSLIRSQNIYNNRFAEQGLAFISGQQADELSNVEVSAGDVLLNITGDSVARCCQAPADVLPARVNQHVAIIRPDPERLDPKFLRYFLVSPQMQEQMLMLAGAGATRKALTKSMIESFEVPTPNITEQCGIANVLGTLDDKIELNSRMNETLEAMTQALFKSWFVDATQNGLPEGWRETTIREVATNIQYGLTQSASTEAVGPRFLRITDIQGGRVSWGNVPFCTVSREEHERYRLESGDVLVARTGASTGENIYLPAVPDAVFASYLVRFQFSDAAIARFVGAFMRTPEYFDYVSGCIGGSAQPNASAQVLAGAELVLPDSGLVQRYAEIVAPIDKRIFANNEESRMLTGLRDSLLPRLMSGELRVS